MPVGVARKPDKRGLYAGSCRIHGRNPGAPVRAASCARRTHASSSTDSQTRWAVHAAARSSAAAFASPGAGPTTPRPKVCGRWGVPCDESHGVQPGRASGEASGGRNARGGSHPAVGGWRTGGGIRVPPASGAVTVAPAVLDPARAGPGASGGLARQEHERVPTPAAERSRAPPLPSRGRVGGGGGRPGPGPSPQ